MYLNKYSGMTASINIKGYYIEKLYQGPAYSVSNQLCTVRWTRELSCTHTNFNDVENKKNGKRITWPHTGKVSVKYSSIAK